MRFVLLLCSIVLSTTSKSIFKRNAYGDEPVTPHAGITTLVSERTPAEQAPVAVEQATPASCTPNSIAQQDSGYRRRRNSYGDEQVTPVLASANIVLTSPPVEQPPIAVEQPTPVVCPPISIPQQDSGY
uniref:Secreted protein n=1 Tax=Heterorhabditis bacteriophora TaxID=37862 RepID=A0A1I7XQZ4_HETBA